MILIMILALLHKKIIKHIMTYLQLLLINIKSSSWFLKVISMGLIYFAPIQMAFITMLILVFIDLIAKIIALTKTGEKIKLSRLVRGTATKLSTYIISIISLFMFQAMFLKGFIDLTHLFVGILSAGEVSSIFGNMFVITNNKVFIYIKDYIDEWVKNKFKK